MLIINADISGGGGGICETLLPSEAGLWKFCAQGGESGNFFWIFKKKKRERERER